MGQISLSTWVLVGALAGLALILIRHWGMKPVKHKNVSLRQLEKYLQVLLRRGYDGGLMFIQPPSGSREEWFLQFRKYLYGESAGLQFGFPQAPWSERYYSRLKEVLAGAGVPYHIQKAGEFEVKEFAIADISRDLDQGVQIVRLVLEDVFGRDPDGVVEVYFRAISPKDEQIGR